MELQGDSTVTPNDESVSNIQGDGLVLEPNGVVKKTSPLRNNLNTNVTVANSSWDNMGYMCVSMEAVDHATIETDTFANCHEYAVYFEYDTYSTADHNGQPAFAAQDNVTFTHDNFDGCDATGSPLSKASSQACKSRTSSSRTTPCRTGVPGPGARDRLGQDHPVR